MSEALASHPPSVIAAIPDSGQLDGASSRNQETHDGLIGLLHEAAGEAVGLGVVYQALSLVAARFELRDAVVAVTNQDFGFQAFRLDGRVVDPAQLDRLSGGESFISEPDVVPPPVRRFVVGLTDVALGIQAARRQQLRDRATGLLSRGVFNEALRAAAAQSSRYGWTFSVMVLRVHERDGQLGEAELRRLGQAFAGALRSGDSGGRIQGSTFAALLPNATSDALQALVRRFLEESGLGAGGVHYASATAPNESVDAAELFRLAASRMHHDQ